MRPGIFVEWPIGAVLVRLECTVQYEVTLSLSRSWSLYLLLVLSRVVSFLWIYMICIKILWPIVCHLAYASSSICLRRLCFARLSSLKTFLSIKIRKNCEGLF